MTEKQKEMLWKKQRIVDLAEKNLTPKQIHKQFNQELEKQGLKKVGKQYIYKYMKILNVNK